MSESPKANDPAEPRPPLLPVEASSVSTRHEVSRWRWILHLGLIGGYPLILGILSARATDRGPALPGNFRELLLATGLGLLTFLAVLLPGWIASRATRDEMLLPWRPGWWVLPLGIGYSLAIRLLAGLGIAAILLALVVIRVIPADQIQNFVTDNRPQVENLVDMKALTQDPAYYWFTITIVSFVLAGLREELWRAAFLAGMRGVWPRMFSSKFGQILAVAIGAVIFGLGHLQMGGLAVAMAGLLGFLLGLIMILHRSIWPAVLAHGFFDATTFAVLPLFTEVLESTRKSLGH